MLTPRNFEETEDWFKRLDKPLQRLPARERADVHTEVRQHLEELAAAHEELGSSPEEAWSFALAQFGNPQQFGRKMSQEWQKSQTSFRADRKAIGFGIGLNALAGLVCTALFACASPLLGLISTFAAGLLVNGILGRRYPLQALKSSLWSSLFCEIGGLTAIVLAVRLVPDAMTINVTAAPFHAIALLYLLPWAGTAYLASMTKRGWYRPTLEDFSLTLPRLRRARE